MFPHESDEQYGGTKKIGDSAVDAHMCQKKHRSEGYWGGKRADGHSALFFFLMNFHLQHGVRGVIF